MRAPSCKGFSMIFRKRMCADAPVRATVPTKVRLLLAMLAVVPGIGLAADHDNDDASARRQAMYEWYTDDYSHHGEPGFTNQKQMYFAAEYERFLNEAAQRERKRYGALLPGGKTIGSPQVLSTGDWFNIGPDRAK